MKKLMLLAFLIMSAQTVMAQVCEVDMVDRYNRVVRTFRAYGDPNTCIEGMKECRKTIRLSPQYGGVDCIRRGDYNPYPNPNPNPYPNPNPNPYPQPNLNYYLSMSNSQLAQEALYTGIGRCSVGQGSYNSSCDYYVRVNGYGFPQGGTGCASSQYTYRYGCNSYSEYDNAGCMIRLALQQRQCF